MTGFTTFTTSSVRAIEIMETLSVQSILPIRTDLGQRNLLEPVLKSNLDFAMKAVEALPISKRTNAVLNVAGEYTLLRIKTGQPIFNHTVWNDGDGLKLLQKVTLKNTKLTAKDIDKSHFAGHCCKDELQSCMNRARAEAGSKEGGCYNVELKIICGELLLTYVTQNPSRTIEIQPEWRAKLKDEYLTDVLRVMNHVEKSGEMSPGMLVCFHHLIKIWSKNANPYSNFQIVLVNKGQRVEFFGKQYDGVQPSESTVIYSGANNIPEMCKMMRCPFFD